MVEDFHTKSDICREGQRLPSSTASGSYLEEGVRLNLFDAKSENSKGCEFLKGFEITHSTPGGSAISDSATPKERTEYLTNPENRLSGDVRSLWDGNNRVLAIGDQHQTLGIKQHTIDNMRAYREAGAEAIGMEFLPLRSQPDLDRYAQLRRDSSTPPEELARARQTIDNLFHTALESPGDKPEDRERYEPALARTTGIVDAAIDAGIRPIAIEPNVSRPFADDAGYTFMHAGMRNLSAASQSAFETYVNPASSKEQLGTARQALEQDLQKWPESTNFFKALDEARAAGLDFSGMKVPRGAEEQDSLWNERLHDVRNRTWAEQSAKFLSANPDARMLLFAGAQHFQYEQRESPSILSANERLKDLGMGTTVLQFAGGDFAQPQHFNGELDALSGFYAQQHGLARGQDGKYPSPPDSAQTAALRYTVPAQEAGVSRQEFAIRLAPQGPREADYVIHLPQ